MNFLNFLTTGASRIPFLISVFNFNLQNLGSRSTSSDPLTPISSSKPEGKTEELTVEQRSQLEAISQQNQHLFNQYMHLNLQLLNQKLENLEKIPDEDKKQLSQKEDASEEAKSLRKKK